MPDTYANLKYFQDLHLETKINLFYIKFAVLTVVMINIVVFWVMKVEAAYFSKTLALIYQTTWHHNPEDNRNQQRC
jgi:uncharacterized membrane protein